MSENILRLLAGGGIGDAVLATPAVAALRAAHPSRRIVLYHLSAWHRDVFLHNPNLDGLVCLEQRRAIVSRCLYRFRRNRFLSLNYDRFSVSLSYEKSAIFVIGDMLGVQIGDPRMRIYLTDAEEHDARERLAGVRVPVIIQITSRATPNQAWPIEHWGALVRRCPDVSFIQLGLSDEPAVPGAIDWRGRTSLREAFALVKVAAAFVGIVSGLGHISAAVGTPAVILFGPSQPQIWGHANSINLDRALPCAPCIDLLTSTPCPYGARCMTSIDVDLVEAALRTQLGQASPVASRVVA